jgi:hypothetical protein
LPSHPQCSAVTENLRSPYYYGADMEICEALEIVRKLADGVHPDTGQVLPGDCLFQHPQAIRALQYAVDALEAQDQRRRMRNSMPPNAGKPWTDDEDQRLSEELRHGISLQEIATAHSRRVGSIVARIMRIRQKIPVQRRSIA